MTQYAASLLAIVVIVGAADSSPVPTKLSLKLSDEVKIRDVEERLESELSAQGADESARLREFERTLVSTYNSLPKSTDGTLGHEAVRYVLHRLFVQRRGWFIRGLEPDTRGVSSPSTLQDWVPSYLQALLERREKDLGEKGTSLQELAAMAAAIEDLVAGEAGARLKDAFLTHGLSIEEKVDEGTVEHAMLAYYVNFLLGGTFSAKTPEDAESGINEFTIGYAGWPEAEEWLHETTARYLKPDSEGKVDFIAAKNLSVEIGQQYYTFNDRECLDLKKTLMNSEGSKPGRVRLSAFYKQALYSHWHFTEKADYLRTLGALDESEPDKLRVITANYMMSRPNCLESSGFYAICCRNECEDLMGHLESKIGAPTATPSEISALVSALPSDTVSAPRNLSAELLDRLEQVAKRGNGSVPIHGRLFAQWMHHVYPRECPYPHVSGTTSPQTPDEWIQETGQTKSEASAEEMWGQVERDTCAVGPNGGVLCNEEEGGGLPWSDVEELLCTDGTTSDDESSAITSLEGVQATTDTEENSTKRFLLPMAVFSCFFATGSSVAGGRLLQRLAPGFFVLSVVLVGLFFDLFDLRAFAMAFCGSLILLVAHLASARFHGPRMLSKAEKCCV